MTRKSYRVTFPGSQGFALSGIVDRPDESRANETRQDHPHGKVADSVPVAVFSHCFTCNKDLKAIVRISRALAEAGVAVLRYDMTGLGGSEGDFSRTSFTTNLADARAAIRFAAQELGPVTALIGHSFGGAASLAIAGAKDLPTLGAVVTLAAPSDTQHLALLLAKMNDSIERDGIGTVQIGGRSWTIRKEMLEDFHRHDLPALVAKIETPTLLMHSPEDQTVGFDHALRLMTLIQSSPAGTPVSMLSIAGADHLLSGKTADLRLAATTTAAFIHRYQTAE